MTLVTYNIQYARGKDERFDLGRIAATVSGADVIGLNEVERFWPRNGAAVDRSSIAGWPGAKAAMATPSSPLRGGIWTTTSASTTASSAVARPTDWSRHASTAMLPAATINPCGSRSTFSRRFLRFTAVVADLTRIRKNVTRVSRPASGLPEAVTKAPCTSRHR